MVRNFDHRGGTIKESSFWREYKMYVKDKEINHFYNRGVFLIKNKFKLLGEYPLIHPLEFSLHYFIFLILDYICRVLFGMDYYLCYLW